MVEKTRAYIAGFLDGDGSIFFQLVRRKDYVFGYQVRASVVFYQNIENIRILRWLKHKLRSGYIRKRNDGLAEYTIVGLKDVSKVIEYIEPFIILKRPQVKLAKRIIPRIIKKKMSSGLLLRIAKEVDKFAFLNYSKKRTNTTQIVREFLVNNRLISL